MKCRFAHLIFILSICSLLGIYSEVHAAVYYVATNGSDANSGSEAQPWRTIQKSANVAVAGDTVYVKEGTYHEKVTVRNSGSSGSYITFSAFPGHTVTIDAAGKSMSYWEGIFTLDNVSYIKISGFRLLHADDHGVICYEADHCVIKGNYTYDTRLSGIGVWRSQEIVIDGNEVELAVNRGDEECITVALSKRVRVINNDVHHDGAGTGGGEGITIKHGSSNCLAKGNYVHDLNELGIYVDAWDSHTYNIVIDGNIIHDCKYEGIALASERGGLLENIRIQNNICFHNVGVGIVIGDWDSGSPHPMRTIFIVNNTSYNNGWNWGGGISVLNPEAQDIIIRNNIVSQNRNFQIGDEVGGSEVVIDYNLIDGFRGTEPAETRGTDYVEGDARFVNPSENDLHLQLDSPAIDNGSGVDAPDHDYEDNLRPSNGSWDIGAYEYQSGPQPPRTDFSASPEVGVVPLTVNFTDQSSGNPTSWLWDFGDGKTDTIQNPTHQYASPGSYTVSLTASNEFGENTKTRQSYISVLPTSTPSIIFSEDFEIGLNWTRSGNARWYARHPKNGTHSVRLRRTGAIEQTIPTVNYEFITISFDIGAYSLDNSKENLQALWYDGQTWQVLAQINNGDAEEDRRLHHFEFSLPNGADDNANFALRFKLNGSGGGDYGYVDDVAVKGVPMGPQPQPAPVAEFSASPINGVAPLTVNFTDMSSNNPTAWQWNFGDGDASTEQNPIHQYPTPGTYTVSLTAINANGQDTETKAEYIVVTESSQGIIFADDFELEFSDWYTERRVRWYSGNPKIGSHSIQMKKNNCWMERQVSTAGNFDIVFSFYMGAKSFERWETLGAYWYDGNDWHEVQTIENGDPEEDGQLHYFETSLPSTADDNPEFRIGFGLWDARAGDFGYLDNIQVEGTHE